LLKHHGLDLRAGDLERTLLEPLPAIDRTVPGFEDFALEGGRAIEPGSPCRSLLYHALASPRVGVGGGIHGVGGFPTPAELETIENFVYAVARMSLADLEIRSDGAPLAIVVFAREYRPAINTVHRRHADMCYSRTGVARVGDAPARYVPAARGYTPFDAPSPHRVRALPCRYAAYIAVQLPGRADRFGPMQFQQSRTITKDFGGKIETVVVPGDDERKFWAPVHKLFGGPECLRGMELTVRLKATHVNEKLRRVHLALGGRGFATGWSEPDLSTWPFTFSTGIAEFSTHRDDGPGLLVPVPHERLVERARTRGGRLVTFTVPTNKPYASSFNPGSSPSGARATPEYVHARHRLDGKNGVTDLGNQPDVRGLVARGGYKAVQYVDFTGDGWIEADIDDRPNEAPGPSLALQVPRRLAAYSMVAPVDYFPRVKQAELIQWWTRSSPPGLVSKVWPDNPGPPLALSDMRFPTNLTLTGASFDAEDDTMTAVVGSLSDERAPTLVLPQREFRAVSLPDGAAGVFAPGWDTSLDRTPETDPTDEKLLVRPGVYHLAAHGLGSPFPEDAKLCAALSAFWPAASPDITRAFAPGRYATATPLTDDVIGVGGRPGWDGTPGPRLIPRAKEVEYYSLDYVDWVEATLQQQFRFDRISDLGPEEYAARTLVTANVYHGLGATTTADKRRWAIYSFTKLAPSDAAWGEACAEARRSLSSRFTYKYLVFAPTGERRVRDFRRVRVAFDEMITVVADPHTLLFKPGDGRWRLGSLEP
jgi:hypothetical protein